MTAKTPVYGLEYLIQGEPMRATRAALENNAKTTEAALVRGGIAPPAAQDLATLAGRVSALEVRPRARLLADSAAGVSYPNAGYSVVPLAAPSPAARTFISGMGWASGTPSRLTCQVAGLYLIGGAIGWSINGTGDRLAALRLNGADYPGSASNIDAPAAYHATVDIGLQFVDLAVNDYIELVGHQTSGAALAPAPNNTNQCGRLTAVRIG